MEFLDSIILSNSISDLLLTLLVILIVAISRKWISRNVASLLYMIIQKKWKSVERDIFIGLIIKPLGSFLTLIIALLTISNLNFPDAWNIKIYGRGLDHLLHVAGKSLVLLYLIWVATSFIDFIALVLDANAKANKDKRDDQLIVFFRDFVKVVIYVIGVLLILKIGFGVDIGALLTGLSIVGAALALAAKESIENLIASFIIFFDKPFFTGDLVKLNTVSGTVEHIGLRSTRIRTADHTLVSVPNKQMVDSVVDNWSMRNARRAEIKLELDNAAEIEVLNEFMKKVSALMNGKSPQIRNHSVFITDYNRSSVLMTIEYFTGNIAHEEYCRIKQEMILSVKGMLLQSGIKMATAGHDINIYNNDIGGSGSFTSQIV